MKIIELRLVNVIESVIHVMQTHTDNSEKLSGGVIDFETEVSVASVSVMFVPEMHTNPPV